MEKDNVIKKDGELTIEEQLDEISSWLLANKDRITDAKCGVSFVHYRKDGDRTRCSAAQFLRTPDMVSLIDLCLTNLKSMIDPDEKDYKKFLASALIMLGMTHKEIKPEDILNT